MSSRENGPLVCLLVAIVIAVIGGSELRLPTVKGWHMEWLWYMSPGVSFHLLINICTIDPFFRCGTQRLLLVIPTEGQVLKLFTYC